MDFNYIVHILIVLNFNVYCHQAVGREWDAIHLYIEKNIDWMKVWIERCEQSSHWISREGVASMVKEAHCNGDGNITESEIDLAYGLEDKMASILINHSKYFILQITFWCTCSFPFIAA